MASSGREEAGRRGIGPRAFGWSLASLFGLTQVLILAATIDAAFRHVRAVAGDVAVIDTWLSAREAPYLFASVVIAGVGFVAIGLMFDLRWRWRWYALAGLSLAAFIVFGAGAAEPKIDGYATPDGAGFLRRRGPATAFHRWEAAVRIDISCRIGGSRTPNRTLHVNATFADGNVAAMSRDLSNASFPDFLRAAEMIEFRASREPGRAIISRNADSGCEDRAPAGLQARLRQLTGAQ